MAADNAPAKRSRDEAGISQESAAKRPRYNYDDMIVVPVGQAEERFTVHKEIICAKSKFFKAACSDCWLKGHQKTVRLPGVEVEIFQRYVDWIYTNDLAEDDLRKSHQPYIKLHLLGSYLNDVKFQNKSMELIIAVGENFIYDYSKTIKILVGHNRFPFIVHKDVICIKSSFIRAHFEQRSDDNPENGILLSEIRPADFNLYVDWAYEKTLDTATTSNTPMTGLIRLYMLGEQLEDEVLCQRAMQQLSSRLCNCDMCFLFAESNKTKSMCEVWDNVEVIWAETKAESMLRRWLVDVTIAKGREVNFEGRLGRFLQELKDEVLIKLMQQTPRVDHNTFCGKTSESFV